MILALVKSFGQPIISLSLFWKLTSSIYVSLDLLWSLCSMTKICFPHWFLTFFHLCFEHLCNISLESQDKFYLFLFFCAKAASFFFLQTHTGSYICILIWECYRLLCYFQKHMIINVGSSNYFCCPQWLFFNFNNGYNFICFGQLNSMNVFPALPCLAPFLTVEISLSLICKKDSRMDSHPSITSVKEKALRKYSVQAQKFHGFINCAPKS